MWLAHTGQNLAELVFPLAAILLHSFISPLISMASESIIAVMLKALVESFWHCLQWHAATAIGGLESL